MPLAEKSFSRSQLWPPSNFHWMAPGAVQSVTAMYGPGLDLGALRVQNGIWEIIVSRTPTPADPRNSEWIAFDPKNKVQLFYANGFNRYGPGWSYGPGHNMHSEVITYFQEVNGRPPTKMEQLDIEHDKALYQALLKDYQIKIGFKPEDPGGPPVTPPPIPPPPIPPTTTLPGLPSLSSPEQRAAELLSLLPGVFQQPWLVPLVIEAVKAVRRGEDRIVQRVLAGLKS